MYRSRVTSVHRLNDRREKQSDGTLLYNSVDGKRGIDKLKTASIFIISILRSMKPIEYNKDISTSYHATYGIYQLFLCDTCAFKSTSQ